MTGQDHQPADAAELRRRAEAVARDRVARSPEAPAALSPEQTRQMLHELQVQQIELEMQNEELRRAQGELEAARARYFELYDLAPVGYFTLSERGLILEANLTVATLLGVVRSVLVKQAFSRFILKEDQKLYYLFRNKLLETPSTGSGQAGEPQECELRLVKPDGSPFWAHLMVTAAQAEDGAPVWRVALSDVTERKRHEDELRMARELSERIIEDGPVAITQVDRDGNIVFANRHAERLFGLERPNLEALGYNSPEWLITDVDGSPFPDECLPFRQVMSTGQAVYDVQHAITMPDAARKILSINGAPLHDEQGRIDRVVFAIQDITERKRAEEALQESEASVRRRLQIILEPEGEIGSIRLSDVINKDDLQVLMDEFFRLTGAASAILDTQGNVLVACGWQDLCTRFHRAHPDTRQHCVESDTVLTSGTAPGEVKCYRCRNGLWDVVTPIYIGGNHIGNVFFGQFFFDDESPDGDHFRRQARQYGFDEEAYLAALDRVPRWSREKVERIMAFYSRLAATISMQGYGNLRLARALTSHERTLAAQHQAAAKIAESERLLSRAQEIAHIGSWKLDLTDNRLTWSDEIYRIFGYEPQEFAATSEAFLDAVHPDDRAALDEAYSRSLRQGSDGYEIEHRIVLRNSCDVRYVHQRCIHERDDSGTIIQSTGMVQDISERKKAEEHLQKYRQIVSSTSEGISLLDKNYCYVIVNRAYATFSGKKQEELTGITVAEYLGEATFCEQIQPQFDKCLRGETIRYLDWFEYPTLGRRFVEVTYFPYIDARGDISGVVANTRDITDRKRAEDALRQSEETHRALVDGLPDIVMRFDREGRFLFVSDNVREVIDIEVAQFIGKTHADLGFPEAQCQFWDESIRHVFDSGAAFETEFTVEGKAGAATFNWRLVPERDALGAVSSVLSISRDITSRKQAEAEREHLQARLIQAQKMESVGRLAGGVAHDFNNMLQAILGNTELALEQVSPGTSLHAELEEIRKSAKRSADLTRQLLAFARKQTISPKVVDLNETTKDMLNMLRRLIGEDIDLSWRPGKEVWPVRMDPSQIDQILANLCVNARDAIAGVGRITIETDKATFDEEYCTRHAGFVPGDYVLLTVSDDGCGMDAETLSQIFEPFFTTKEFGKGTGLGLATVYGVVKQNQGFVTVYSKPGRGTTFTIYLPRHATKAVQETEERGPQATARCSETILLVEDELAILRMTTMMLEGLGYTVLAAGTSGEALRLATAHAGAIHLLVTDVVMPEMNGRDLAKHLLSLHPNLKCLFMSGYTADVIAHQGVLAAGVQFIQKPFSLKDFAAKLRQALEGDRGRQ